MSSTRSNRSYRTFEEFHREEIRSGQKLGFSVDDLFHEATFNADQEIQYDRDELDFGR